MVQAEPDQRAAGVGVVDRRLLAEEVRQKDQPVGAWRQFGGQPIEALMRFLAGGRRGSDSAPAKVAAIQSSIAPEQAMQPFGMNSPGTM